MIIPPPICVFEVRILSQNSIINGNKASELQKIVSKTHSSHSVPKDGIW
ncbi:hypothetical protein OIU79_023768 [Salix purpurea]|uniref:Uncharacterized protein n=1 Tax=Salix purpurea TaxID=77065 RepID=A0A9Q0WCE6_SALPP|nr:hypothetical protein OIU79_023768 [Salix purpurea]